MNRPPDEQASLADDIVEVSSYEAAAPKRKDFLPWHKPRKQFVRSRQWLAQIIKMIDDVPLADATLKYFGLPGTDLLDLRYFYEHVCAPRGLELRFLGFNTAIRKPADQVEMNISLDEVRRMMRVDQRSEVLGDDFSRVSNTNSIAWKRALDLGPFDVINLDLCNGFAAQDAGAISDTHYNALAQLLALQSRQKTPWLLLLTTLVGKEHVHASVHDKLIEIYSANLDACDEFRAASFEKFQIDTEDSLRAGIDNEQGLVPVQVVSICKWIMKIAYGQQPPSKVETRSVIGYRVHGVTETEDLVSVAIRFTPTFNRAPDAAGLADGAGAPPDECASATQALRRVAARKNADVLLRDDAELNTSMIDDTSSLLESARYDIAEFRQWLVNDVA